MGMVKDRNSKEVADTEDIKKRWPEYMEEWCRKGLNDPDNHNDVVICLEQDIPECEVKWP